MPVLADSTAKGTKLISSASTSGNITVTHRVSPIARDRVFAYAALLWTGEADTTGATFAVTFGGQAMSAKGVRRWDANKGYLALFELEDAPRGPQEVVASFSSMPTEFLSTRNFMLITQTYSGVQASGAPVEVSAGGSSATNTVVVPSERAAHRVLAVHGVGKLRGFTSSGYNQTKRQAAIMLGAGSLLVGDAAGAASVTSTATHSASTSQWAAIGLTLSPSVVEISASSSVSVKLKAAVAIFRVVEPHPDRLWVIPTVGEVDKSVLAGNFTYSADGVQMPVWPKDPQSKLDYTVDWSKHLADDDEIVDAQFITNGALQMFSPSHNESQAQVWLAGGVVGVSYPVVCRITTKRGRQHDRTFRIAIGQQ